MRANEESRNDVNNLKNNIVRVPRQLARQNTARGCEPSSCKLSPQLSSLFPILSVTDGDTTRTYTYHADGQLASATVGSALRADRGRGGDAPLPETETFLWDGLALIQRGDEQFVNEPHVGGGNPIASSKGTSYFNDALGTTVGSKSNGKYSAAALTAFGENLSVDSPTPTQNSNFFTGKPYVEGLGHAFLMRNYRAGLAKWQSADPMGYPDGWNQLAYCNNGVTSAVDLWGCLTIRCVSGGRDVHSAGDIRVYKTTGGTNEGGVFDVHVQSINGVGGDITITLTLSIYMDECLRESADFMTGEQSEYAPHEGINDNSMGRNCVYEAILAHERAHAAYYLDHQKVFFDSLLRMSNIDDGTRTYDEIFNLVERAFYSAWNYGRAASNEAANKATINWFDSHREWRELSPIGSMQRWVKE